jgi:D-alanyl-D-alanine carboxypeptidase/D-alanyl-D-alanine-endopeptidase (penicillin-binding protein 4)
MALILAILVLASVPPALADPYPAARKRIQAIMNRPEYRHSRFGMEFYCIETGKVLYAWRPDELFIPGSTTKLLSVGSALELLGADFRFHTRIYRTGEIDAAGVLNGDLVLLAAGDPNLSGRIQPDGSLAFQDEDHSYDGFAEACPVAGDPLAVIRDLAGQVAARGVKEVRGRVLVDASLFEEGAHELGTGVVLSPIVVNDNLVDVLARPGGTPGDTASLETSPVTHYVRIVNQVTTSAAGVSPALRWGRDTTNTDGTHSIALTGSVPAGHAPVLKVYKVPAPSAFAAIVLTEALERLGVHLGSPMPDLHPAHTAVARFYTPDRELADHVSPPLAHAARVILKVSQNLHASMLPYLIGAYLDPSAADPAQAGFDRERAMLQKADLDLTGAVQNDGAGGSAMFTPDFMVRFLLYMRRRPYFAAFRDGLPVLGKDGTLAAIQVQTPAAGHVFAKTGTYGIGNALTRGGVISGKGLAGFIDTKDGRHLAFAAYVNFVPLGKMSEEATQSVGQALGEIAAVGYDGFGSK